MTTVYPDPNEVARLVAEAMEWAREAGEALLTYFRHPGLKVETKLNESDIVTEADKASERIVIGHLRRAHPDHSILSEESGLSERPDADWEWVIDPLDGTTNFSAGLPLFCVSIGLTFRGQGVGGVVYAPYLREMFHGVRGQGAWLNGRPIKVSGKQRIDRAVVATGFPVDKDVNPDNNVDNLTRVLPLVRGMRRLGSAAIDISYVAAGYLDGYWEMNLHEWDVAAALVILQEAGGEYTHFRADRNVSIVAGTPAIHALLAPLLR